VEVADTTDPRVAVYIDFDNIVISRYDQVYGRGKFTANKIRELKTLRTPENAEAAALAVRATVDVSAIVDFATSFGPVVISRAYADWSVPANSRYSKQLVDRAVDLTQLFPTVMRTKNGADIRLSVDVVEDMFRLPDITHVVIVAGDSDFIPLAQRCKRLGRYVVGIGVAGATSPQLAAACNEYRYYGELPGLNPESADDAPAIVAAATASATAPAAKAPTRRASSKPVAAVLEEPEQADDESLAPGTGATELLLRAMRLGHSKTDDEWLHSSSVKNQMLRMDPSFSEKSLGFKSFSDFVKSRESAVQIGKGDSAGRVKLRAGS
jgi:uncharacterized LabA/DUF88 family protein